MPYAAAISGRAASRVRSSARSHRTSAMRWNTPPGDRSRFAMLSHAAFEEPIIETSIASGASATILEPAPPALPPTGYGQAPAAPPAARFTTETVLALRHWTPSLLSFRVSRAPGFRFTPGHYARLGLDGAANGIIWRSFSVVSGAHDQYLEFFAVLVPGGDFSGPLS